MVSDDLVGGGTAFSAGGTGGFQRPLVVLMDRSVDLVSALRHNRWGSAPVGSCSCIAVVRRIQYFVADRLPVALVVWRCLPHSRFECHLAATLCKVCVAFENLNRLGIRGGGNMSCTIETKAVTGGRVFEPQRLGRKCLMLVELQTSHNADGAFVPPPT